jgi:hypothetical protein
VSGLAIVSPERITTKCSGGRKPPWLAPRCATSCATTAGPGGLWRGLLSPDGIEKPGESHADSPGFTPGTLEELDHERLWESRLAKHFRSWALVSGWGLPRAWGQLRDWRQRGVGRRQGRNVAVGRDSTRRQGWRCCCRALVACAQVDLVRLLRSNQGVVQGSVSAHRSVPRSSGFELARVDTHDPSATHRSVGHRRNRHPDRLAASRGAGGIPWGFGSRPVGLWQRPVH